MIGATTIHDNQLLGLKAISFQLQTARPTSMSIEVKRDPSRGPSPLLYALSTNGNGTETKFNGSFELRNAQGVVTHTIAFENASAQSYSTSVPDDVNAPAVEKIVLISPKFAIQAAGQVAEFESREETRHEVG